jgi:thioredoxin-related protein
MTMRTVLRSLLVVAAVLQLGPESVAAQPDADSGIAWVHAATDADVDAAFARARVQHQPLFLYWGAAWCPPCNQLKATLFNRADFIERSRAFVPVYVDGDSPGAQKLGTRFKVRGYPTVLLFDANGTELTRLPGEVDPQVYTQLLTLGMNAQRPVKEVLAAVRAGGAGLTENDWKLLAFYSWESDESQVVPEAELPALLKQLAQACPPVHTETAMRLLLKALAAVDAKKAAAPDSAALPRVLALLADAARARRHMDVLTNNAADLVRALSARATPQRAQALRAFDGALVRLAADTSLSRGDRLTALIARVDLVRIDAPEAAAPHRKAPPSTPLPVALLTELREQSARADREITDGDERQAVITTAAYALGHAGLGTEADALLQANLAKSHSPYYLMSALASHAKERGDAAAALRWSQQAFDTSAGTATRLQWGASLVSLLVELAPRDEARIEATVMQLWALAEAQPDAFFERSGRSLQRVGSRLAVWNQSGTHPAVMKRLQARLDAVCVRLPPSDPQRPSCRAVMAAAPAKPA